MGSKHYKLQNQILDLYCDLVTKMQCHLVHINNELAVNTKQ